MSLLIGYVLYQQKSAADKTGDGTKLIQNGKTQDEASLTSDLHVDPKRPVLLPSSKRITMPLFTKSERGKGLDPIVATGNAASISDSKPLTAEGIDALIQEAAGRSGDPKGETPRTLMHSSKLSVVVIPRIKEVDTEDRMGISRSDSKSTLDVETPNAADLDPLNLDSRRIKWILPPAISNTFENPTEKSINDEKRSLMGSSKSGAVRLAPYRFYEHSYVTEKLERAMMPSSKSGSVFFRPIKKAQEEPAKPKRTLMRSTKSFPLLNQ